MPRALYTYLRFCADCRSAVLLAFLFTTFAAAGHEVTVPNRNVDSTLEAIMHLVYDADYIRARERAIHELQHSGGDALYEASLYCILGDIESATGNRKKSLYYLRKAEKALRSDPKLESRLCVVAWKYANLYYEGRQYDSAYYYAKYAIDSSKVHFPSKYPGLLASNLPIIGYHHYIHGDYAAAERCYNEALAVNEANGSRNENVNTYLKIADLKAKRSDYNGAAGAAEKAYALAVEFNIQQYKLAAVNKLIDIHRQFGNYKEVARCLQLKMDLQEAIELADQKKTLKELETKYKTELKEQENSALKAINKKQQAQNSSLLIIIVLSAIVALAVLIFAVIFFTQKNRIKRQKANVERLNALNQKIFSVISHDFKGPMMGLDLLLGMLEKYKLDPERFTSQSNQLRSDLKQAELILENLLSWSKTELGMGDPQQKQCQPAQVACSVIAQLDVLLRQKHLSVQCSLPEELTIAVASDSFAIILRNLLSNAIKYSHEGGTITIAWDGQTRTFAVSDEGIGMEPERLEQLFDRQLDSRLGTSHETGYGIGLNFVYELVRKNDGHIRMESAAGEGTTVYFDFNGKRTHGKR